MEKLTIEQKAQRYDEVAERAKTEKEKSRNLGLLEFIDENFPELKESEDDRIRNEIIAFVEQAIHRGGGTPIPEEQEAKWIAWLEKQGRHQKFIDAIQMGDRVTRNKNGMLVNLSQLSRVAKPADKIAPNFKVGEWIINNISKNVFLIKSINNGYYTLEDIKGNITSPCLLPRENKYHLWTIKDAKDGDVLAVEPIDGYPSPFIAIYKERGLDFFNSHCFVSRDGEFHEGTTGHDINLVYPATKEQRDTLEKAMADAGYIFDFEKKELKKIEQKPVEWSNESRQKQDVSIQINPSEYINDMGGNGCYLKNPVQSSTWNEEDEKIFDRICDLIHSAAFKNYDVDEDGNECGEYANIKGWFEKLKERVQSQPEQGWSEEDERIYKSITYSFANNYPLTIQQQEFVKSLKDRVGCEANCTTTKELSAEDKKNLLDIKCIIDEVWHNQYIRETTDHLELLWHWLDNIWQRVRYPQSQWKPTEEYLKSLEIACDRNDRVGFDLTQLLEELKKLKNKQL